MLVELGLKSAKEGYKADGSDELAYRPVEGLRVLEVNIPDGVSTGEAFSTLTAAQGVVAYHTDDAPIWVVCVDKPALEALLAEHFECSTGKPDDVEQTHWTAAGPPGVDGTAAPADGAAPTDGATLAPPVDPAAAPADAAAPAADVTSEVHGDAAQTPTPPVADQPGAAPASPTDAPAPTAVTDGNVFVPPAA